MLRRCLSKFGFRLVSGLERDLIDSITQRSSRLVRYEDFAEALRVDIRCVTAQSHPAVLDVTHGVNDFGVCRLHRSDSALDDVILRLRKHFSRDSKHGKDIEEVPSAACRLCQE